MGLRRQRPQSPEFRKGGGRGAWQAAGREEGVRPRQKHSLLNFGREGGGGGLAGGGRRGGGSARGGRPRRDSPTLEFWKGERGGGKRGGGGRARPGPKMRKKHFLLSARGGGGEGGGGRREERGGGVGYRGESLGGDPPKNTETERRKVLFGAENRCGSVMNGLAVEGWASLCARPVRPGTADQVRTIRQGVRFISQVANKNTVRPRKCVGCTEHNLV